MLARTKHNTAVFAMVLVLGGCSSCIPGERAVWVDELLNEGTGPGRIGDPGPGCPADSVTANQEHIDSLCRVVLPRSAKLWFTSGPEGEPCWCACRELQALSPLTLDSLILADKARQRKTTLLRKSAFVKPGPVPYKAKSDTTLRSAISAGLLRVDTTLRLHTLRRFGPRPERPVNRSLMFSVVPEECDAADWEVMLLGEWVYMGDIIDRIHEAFPVFTLSCTKRGRWPVVTGFSDYSDAPEGSEVPSDAGGLDIQLPEEFVVHEEVGGELIVYMLLHELGHGLAPIKGCSDGSEQVCEGMADWWAGAVGLRKVFPGADWATISAAARDQLSAYYEAIGLALDCGTPFCGCDNIACGYPPVGCRQAIMRKACYASRTKAACMREWADAHEPCTACPAAD